MLYGTTINGNTAQASKSTQRRIPHNQCAASLAEQPAMDQQFAQPADGQRRGQRQRQPDPARLGHADVRRCEQLQRQYDGRRPRAADVRAARWFRPSRYVGCSASGSFTQSGGSNYIGNSQFLSLYLGYNAGASGAYSLSGSGQLTAIQYIGYSGSGSFTQSGGTNNVLAAQNLFLGYNLGGSGTYSLSNGLLSVITETIGYSGSGGFTQSGGTNGGGGGNGCVLNMGYTSVGRGAYNLGDGLLLAAGENIGENGTGSFTQTAGTNSLVSSQALAIGSGNAVHSGS